MLARFIEVRELLYGEDTLLFILGHDLARDAAKETQTVFLFSNRPTLASIFTIGTMFVQKHRGGLGRLAQPFFETADVGHQIFHASREFDSRGISPG